MPEFTDGAQRLFKKRRSQIERELRKSGAHTDEIEAVSDGLQEFISESFAVADIVDKSIMAARLKEFDLTLPEIADAPHSMDGLGRIAMGVALSTVFGIVAAGGLSDLWGFDGGAAMSTVGLFGVGVTLVLGILSRQSKYGRASLWTIACVGVLFVIALIIASLEQ